MLTEPLENLLLSLPFLVCGALCFLCKKHPGLYCGWAIWLMLDLFLRFCTSAHWIIVNFLLTNPQHIATYPIQLLVGLTELGFMAGLIGTTIHLHRNSPIELSRLQYALVLGGWVGFILLHLIRMPQTLDMLLQVLFSPLLCIRIILFTFLATVTIHWVRQRRDWKTT